MMAAAADGRPHSVTIAAGPGSTQEDLLRLMQAGIRDVLPGEKPGRAAGNRLPGRRQADRRLRPSWRTVRVCPG